VRCSTGAILKVVYGGRKNRLWIAQLGPINGGSAILLVVLYISV
jgi:hypothetical protein